MRGTRLEVRPAALAANLELARRQAPDAELVAMLKANGYGHGLLTAARAFAKADRLGVALLEEASALRAAGIATPLLIAEGCFDVAELEEAARLGQVACVVHSPWQVAQLEAAQLTAPVTVWLKLDSGMHRLGMSEAMLREHLPRLNILPNVKVTHVMTHLACADKVDDVLSERQIATCLRLAQAFGLKASIANSAALLRYPASLAAAVRPGILLYGSSPFAERSATELGLAVTQRFSARLIAINEVAAGESVGYGGRWQAQQPSRIGVVAVGYGDGYPRHAPNGTPVAVLTAQGVQRAGLAGCVSMDMITIDLTSVPAARVGDEVELWGDHVSADEVATCAGTISYELFCQVTARPLRSEALMLNVEC